MGFTVYVNDVLNTTAFDITVNSIMNGFGTATFSIPNVHIVTSEGARATWVGYMDAPVNIKIYAETTILKFEGHIKTVTGDHTLIIHCEDKTAKLEWYNIPSTKTNFKLATGKVASAPTGVFIDCEDDNGVPTTFTADQFNGKYLILSDATKAISNEECKHANFGDDIIGYDEAHSAAFAETNDYHEVKWGTGDADRWELQYRNSAAGTQYMLVNLDLVNFTIPKTAIIDHITIKYYLYVRTYVSALSTLKNTSLAVLNVFSPDNDITHAKNCNGSTVKYSSVVGFIDNTCYREADIPVGTNWAKFCTKGDDFYEGCWFGFKVQTVDDTDLSYFILKWAGAEVTVYFDTEEFDTINEAIIDTTATEITITTDLNAIGVAEGDSFAVGESMDSAYESLYHTTLSLPDNLPILHINNEILIARGIAEVYEGISAYALFTTLNKLNAYEFFLKYDDNTLRALKEADITLDGGALTGFSEIGDFEIQDDVFGNIDVFWSAQTDENNPAQVTTGIDNPKTFTAKRKDILTYAEAKRVGDELAIKCAAHHRSIPLTFDSWKNLCVGYLYDITINGTVYSDQICRRASFEWKNGQYKIQGYFGGGKTPPDESLAIAIGAIDHRIADVENIATTSNLKVSRVVGSGVPSGHKATHENGGADEISIDASQITSGSIPDARIADDLTLTNITQITNRSHTSLSDIGVHTHAQLDTHMTALDAVIASIGVAEGLATLDTLGYLDDEQIPGYLVTGLHFVDSWDASAGTYPSIVGLENGDFYVCSIAGTVLGIVFAIGDYIIFDADAGGFDFIKGIDGNFYGYKVDTALLKAHSAIVRKISIRPKMPWEIAHIIVFPYDMTEVNNPFDETYIYYFSAVNLNVDVLEAEGALENVLKVENITNGTSPSVNFSLIPSGSHASVGDIDAWLKYESSACITEDTINSKGFMYWIETPQGTHYIHIGLNGANYQILVYDKNNSLITTYNSAIAITTWVHLSVHVYFSAGAIKCTIYENDIAVISAQTIFATGTEINVFDLAIMAKYDAGGLAGNFICAPASPQYNTDYVLRSNYITDYTQPIISTILDSGDAFSDVDTALMTAAAINDRISAVITTEVIQDIVGAMFSGNTETACSVDYQDADGTIDVVLKNDAAATITQIDTATLIADDDTIIPTAKQLAKALMIGSANYTYVPMMFWAGTEVGKVDWINGISNVDGTEMYVNFYLPIPVSRGGLKLYATGHRVTLCDADTGDYITASYLVGMTSAGQTNLWTDASDYGNAADGKGTYTYANAAVDLSTYNAVLIQLWCNPLTNAGDLEIAAVELKCYYAT